MFKNQLALGLKGMINKISSDSNKDSNSNSNKDSVNNTPQNSRSTSVSSDSQRSSSVHNVLNSNQLEDNNYPTDGHEVEGFLCPLCLRAFPSPESLSEHYSSEHSDFSNNFSNNFQCNECKMRFGSQEELESHKIRNHSTLVSTTNEMIKQEISKISSVIESEELELLRGQIKALEESKSLISNECKTLREQLKRSNEEMREIQNELSQLRGSNDDSDILKKELVKVQKLMNDMSVEREKEKELLNQEIKKQMETMANERQSTNKEFEDLKLKHKQSINDLMDMRSKKQKLEVELNLLRNEGLAVSSLRDDIENKCAIIGKLEQNVDIMNKQLETVKSQLEETQRERDLFREGALIRKQLDSQIIEFKQSAEKANKENIELHVMVSQLKTQLETLSSQYESLNIKMKVHEEMKTVGEQLDSKLAQEVEVLKIDLMTAQQNLETSNLNFNKSSEELKKLKKLYQNIKQDKEELAKKFNCVNEEMNLKKSEAQNINENLIKQISLLDNEIKLTKNELENSRINEKQLTLKCDDTNIRLKEMTNQLIEKEKQLKNIEEEKENLELRIEKTDQQFEKLNQQKLSIENNFQIIESENQNLQKKVKETDQKLLDYEHQNCLLNEQLANSSKAIENNQKQFQEDITSKNELIEILNKKLVDYELIMNENNNLLSELKKFELKLKEQSENFNSELNDKSLLIDSQHENITDLNEKLKQSQHQIQTNQSIIDSLKEENIRLEELLQKSEFKLIEVNKNYSEKCVQFEQIDDQNKSFTQLLKNKDLHSNNVEIELKNVGKELENCKQLNGTLEALLKETQTVVQNQKQKIESLENELKKSKQINEDLSLEMKQKFEENEQKVAQNVSTIKSLNEEIMKLRAGFEKEKAKQENQQTLNDQLLGAKLELEAKLSNISEEKRALIERCINSEEECEKLKNEVFQIRHKLDDSIAALHELGRENQSLQIEQTKLVSRKWADDNDVIKCMKCEKAFSVTVRKHHCRNCGQIFCNECSSKSAVMALHPKPVRVCDNCHHDMNQK